MEGIKALVIDRNLFKFGFKELIKLKYKELRGTYRSRDDKASEDRCQERSNVGDTVGDAHEKAGVVGYNVEMIDVESDEGEPT